MTRPTVGAIVHYARAEHRYATLAATLVVYAAIVTGVEDDDRGLVVSLCVFLNARTAKGRADTMQLDCAQYAETPSSHCWSWPPRTP